MLHWMSASEASDVGAVGLELTLFQAVEEQLGLKLVPKKGQIDILVIDHIEKEPTEN